MNEVMRIKNCGMDSAVHQIGDSWSLLIVWSALQGTTRFDNFQSSLGIARAILSIRLSKLVEEGILVKHPVHSGARRLEYRVTGKGEALRPALELIEGWGRGSRSEAHHAGLGTDDDVNGSERPRRGHGFGLDRRLVTMGGGRLSTPVGNWPTWPIEN